MTWRETRARIREDRERLRAYLDADGGGRTVPLWMTPSFQAVVLQRLSHHFYSGGNRLLGRFFWHMNLMLTGADGTAPSGLRVESGEECVRARTSAADPGYRCWETGSSWVGGPSSWVRFAWGTGRGSAP